MATCDVNTLLEDGKEFQRCSDRDLSVCEAQLLCDINTGGGGGGGGGGAQGGVVDPNGVVSGDKYSLYNQFTSAGPPATGFITQWINVDGGTTWV